MKNWILSYILFCIPFITIKAAAPSKAIDSKTNYYFKKLETFKTYRYDSALFYANAIIKSATQKRDNPVLLKGYMERAGVHYEKAAYVKAGEDALSALKLAQALKDTTHIVETMILLGNSYNSVEEHERAFQIHTEAAQIVSKTDTVHRIKLLNSLAGNLFLAEKDRKKCIQYGHEALSLSIKAKQLESEFIAANNLAANYQDEHLCDKALEMADLSFEAAKKIHVAKRTRGAYLRYAELYIYCLNNPKLSLSYLDKYVNFGGNRSDHDTYAMGLYIDCYLALNNYKLAFKYYEQMTDLTDSINDKDRRKNLIDLESKYQGEKKQQEINLLHVKQAAEAQQKKYVYIGLILALLLLAVSIYAAQLYIRKNAHKKLLLKEIHHRINNNLQIISSLLSMQVKDSSDDKIKNMMSESQSRIRSLSLLHKNLYSGDSPDKIKMKEYLGQLINFYTQALQADNQHVSIEVECDEVKLSSKKAVPVGLIVNELVTNAYKYAFPPDYGDGKIKIKMHQHPDGTMTLQVIDNGPETKNKTVKEGFGSKLIRALSNQLGADMQLQTEHGHAYTFNFKIV